MVRRNSIWLVLIAAGFVCSLAMSLSELTIRGAGSYRIRPPKGPALTLSEDC
jgi:hypothetical protein